MAGRPLTVLQMLPALEGGGVERGTLELDAELVRRGYRSLVMSAGGPLVSRLHGEHIAWPVGRKSPAALLLAHRLRRFLARERVDVLHPRSRLPAWIAWLAWRGMPAERRPRFITSVHGIHSVSRYSRIVTRGERVIAVSGAVRDYLLRAYPGIEAGRIRVIHNGVDQAVYPWDYRPPRSWQQRWFAEHAYLLDRLVLTLPGRLTRRKGHADFVFLMKRLVEAGMPVHGLIVGAEDARHAAYARELYAAVQAAGLGDRITFTGQRLDLRDIMAVSNLVLSLSLKPEAFGRTVLEALSMGVPVVGYDHGGVGELLATLYPAGHVPPGDRVALVDRVRALLERPGTVAEQPRFDLAETLDRTIAVYGCEA